MKKVCFFQDFLSDITASQKEKILSKNEVEIITKPFVEKVLLEKGILNSGEISIQYKSFVRELTRNFGINSPAALYSIIRNSNNKWSNLFSLETRDFLYQINRYNEIFSDRILYWALDPENWFLVDSERSAFEIQSQISAEFPCLVFDNFPIECAAQSSPEVNLQFIENIIQMTGVHLIWKNGLFGSNSTISVLDTGIEESSRLKLGVNASGIGSYDSKDIDGHGTAIIEMIKAISPNAKIESIKILESYNRGEIWNLINGLLTFLTKNHHIVCMAFCVNPNWVYNLGGSSTSFQESVFKVFDNFGNNINFPICAAGNYSLNQLLWPSASKNALAIGSHNSSNKLSSFSNYELTAQNFILAPGGDKNERDFRVEYYGRYGPQLSRDIFGTSFSAAIATGISSLLQDFDWFNNMKVQSRISLFKNHCRKNYEGYSLLNIEDIGAVWPI